MPFEEYKVFPKISSEWAKQLAFEFIGHDLDFANMKIINAGNPRKIKFYRFSLNLNLAFINQYDIDKIKIITIELNDYIDLLSKEIHRFAYSKEANLLVFAFDE